MMKLFLNKDEARLIQTCLYKMHGETERFIKENKLSETSALVNEENLAIVEKLIPYFRDKLDKEE